jgi:hypothetical protein
MGTEGPADQYAAMLAGLEDQRTKIDNAIAAIKALQAAGVSVTVTQPSGAELRPSGNKVEIALDAFHTLSVGKAITKYLRMLRRPATTAEIVEALKLGGQAAADGDNFSVVINNTLNRMQGPDSAISRSTMQLC